jgi:hypothetical protein
VQVTVNDLARYQSVVDALLATTKSTRGAAGGRWLRLLLVR